MHINHVLAIYCCTHKFLRCASLNIPNSTRSLFSIAAAICRIRFFDLGFRAHAFGSNLLCSGLKKPSKFLLIFTPDILPALSSVRSTDYSGCPSLCIGNYSYNGCRSVRWWTYSYSNFVCFPVSGLQANHNDACRCERVGGLCIRLLRVVTKVGMMEL